MGWHLMEKLIEQSGEHSSLVGKFWVTSVFILRLLIATSISDDVWDDSQEEFVCNTLSPGCSNVCFNEYSPIALTRYWMLQILFTALPSMIFIVYTAHKLHKLDLVVTERKKVEKARKELDKKRNLEIQQANGGKPQNNDAEDDDNDDKDDDKPVATKLTEDTPSKLFLAYYFVVLSRTVLEIAFIVGQYYLYTFKFMMPELWVCQHWPCPNAVDCFVSRPKEKSVLICVFYATGVMMVCLNLLEIWHISEKLPKAWRDRGDDITKHASQGPMFGGFDENPRWAPGMDYYEEEIDGYPNATGLPTIRPTIHDRRIVHSGHVRTHRRYR